MAVIGLCLIADPWRRRGGERRDPVDRRRAADVPAVGARQARARRLGRGPPCPQGEARHAHRLAAHARAAAAGHRGPRAAGDGGRRPRDDVHPAGHLPGAAVDRRARPGGSSRPC